jgi:hypothetical protein
VHIDTFINYTLQTENTHLKLQSIMVKNRTESIMSSTWGHRHVSDEILRYMTSYNIRASLFAGYASGRNKDKAKEKKRLIKYYATRLLQWLSTHSLLLSMCKC